MDPAEYERMYDLEDLYWWFQGRKHIVASLLERVPSYADRTGRVLDLGCGTGLMLMHMNHERFVVGLDFSPLALAFSRKRGARRLLRADVERLPAASESFDVATALDLAEHVEHDARFFSEVLRILKPGGHFVVTVPAHPYLWSEHDEALYHCRRYTRDVFRRRLLDAGFEIERLSYCISVTYPAIATYRLMQKMFRPADKPKTHVVMLPRWANSLLVKTVRFEAALLKRMNLPFGVTLMAVARKP